MLDLRLIHAPLGALLAVILLSGWAATAQAQATSIDELTEAQIEQVLSLIQAADAAREAGRCGESLAQYREALAILDAAPVHFSLAQCLETLGAHAEAVAELQSVAEVDDAEIRARAAAEIDRIHLDHPGQLVVVTDPVSATVWIEGEEFATDEGALELLVDAGEYGVRVAAEGYVDEERTLVFDFEERVEIRVVLRPDAPVVDAGTAPPIEPGLEGPADLEVALPLEEVPRRRRGAALPVALASGTVVCFAGGTVFGLVNQRLKREWNDYSANSVEGRNRLGDAASQTGRVANVLFVVGGVLAAGTVVTLVVDRGGPRDSAALDARVSPTGGSVRVRW